MTTTAPLQKYQRPVNSVPLQDDYRTIAIVPADIEIILRALEAVFDALAKTDTQAPTLEHIRDLHDFLKRTLLAPKKQRG
jgi:hypothetical protein